MTLLFDGKGSLKVRNGGFLSIFNKTTSRDFHESLSLGSLASQSSYTKALPNPFGIPVIAYASYESGAVTAGIKVLGIVDIPIFHKQVAKVGDTIPINWSAGKLGMSLVGAVTVH